MESTLLFYSLKSPRTKTGHFEKYIAILQLKKSTRTKTGHFEKKIAILQLNPYII